MKEQCWKCYWFKGEPSEFDFCCLSWKNGFNCESDFEPIDDYFYKWITVNEGVSPKWLEKEGKFYVWKREVKEMVEAT